MAGKLPWFSWFAEDWLTSDFFLATDLAAHGLFINVLSKMWTSAACGIGEKVVRAMASRMAPDGVELETQEAISAAVIGELTTHPTRQSLLTHPKLYALWLAADGTSVKRSKAGKKGAAARWSKRPRIGDSGHPNGTCHAIAMRLPMQEPDPDPDPEQDVRQRELPIGSSSGAPERAPPPPEKPPTEPPWKPAHDYVSQWNALAKNLKVRGIQALTPRRKKHLKARERDGLGRIWPDVVRQLEASRTWVDGFRGFCFDWIIQSTDNMTKVAEGKYVDRDAKGNPTHKRHELDHDDSAYDDWLE